MLCEKITSPEELAALMEAITRAMDFRHYALIHHDDLRIPRSDLVDLKNYPTAIAERLIGEDRYRRDPIMRGVIIAIAAIGSVSLIAVTWMALKPRLFQRGDTQQELSQPNVRSTSDGLSGAPATYGDVPRLGPPLPGDLQAYPRTAAAACDGGQSE